MYPIKPLWQICEILLWWTPPRNDKKNFWWGFLWCSIRDMKTKYIFDTNEKLTDLWVKNSNVKLLKEWTLFMSFKLSLWKLAFAWKDLYTNEAIAWLPIKNENELDKEFLYYILSWYDFTSSWTDNSVKWATLNKAKLEKLPIPLPPLSTQKLIVQKLDSAFENIDKNINLTKENLKNIEDLNKSVLEKVFSDWDYDEVIFWKICDFVRWPFWWSLKKEIFKKSWYAVYEQMHAIWDQYKEIRYYIDEEKFNEMKRFELNSWNLIMSCSGTMWKVSIVPEWIRKWIINQALLAIKPSEKLLNKYLKLYMESWVFQNEITKYSKWAAIKNVASVKILKEIKIPLPSLQKQKEIVSYLDEVFAKNKELKTKYELQLKELEELKQSLLKDAFEGRLVKE